MPGRFEPSAMTGTTEQPAAANRKAAVKTSSDTISPVVCLVCDAGTCTQCCLSSLFPKYEPLQRRAFRRLVEGYFPVEAYRGFAPS